MELIHGNEKNFNELVASDLVLVDFFASWCGPCRMLGPVLDEIASDRSTFKIVKIDVDECASLARTYNVMSVPTMIIFKNGKVVDQKTGFLPKEELIEWVESK